MVDYGGSFVYMPIKKQIHWEAQIYVPVQTPRAYKVK